MKFKLYKVLVFFSVSSIYLLSLLSSRKIVLAQIIPDATLPSESVVIPDGNLNIITGGSRAGNNLFHSFKEFSILKDSTAYFNNSENIQNIISRITGGGASIIDGLISANGAANLFIINPNGIVFGQSARLNIGGSFLGSTADSVIFADGTQFNASNPQVSTLLNINVPIGLQFTGKSKAINVQGSGHNQSVLSNPGVGVSSISLLGSGESQNGIRLRSEKTFALVGNDVNFDGGVVTTPSGKIEIGSISSGTVGLNSDPSGWSLNYREINEFKDIRFVKQSLLDASGNTFGDIHIQGRNVIFTDASLALIANFGSLDSGAIRIDASETLDMTGVTSFNSTQPLLFLSNRSLNRGLVTSTESGRGGDIVISAKDVIGRDSVVITPLTFGSGNSGNLVITSTESIQILGTGANEFSGISSTFGTTTYSNGRAGDVSLSANNLLLQDGGGLRSLTFGSGKGGNVNVNVDEIVKLSGGYSNFLFLPSPVPYFSPSSITSLSISSGSAGNIDISTRYLIIENGSGIATSGLKTGNSGIVNINASESVNVSGRSLVNPSLNPSRIFSAVGTGDPFIGYLYNLTDPPNALSGNILLNTRKLTVEDGAEVGVKNDSIQNAGTLMVNADSIVLDNESLFSASTQGGEGGNILLNSQSLQLSQNSAINTTANGKGDGGNIVINTDTLVSLNNSTINANAFEGAGGNITINTQGIFRSSDSKFTASSDRGINGSVQINTSQTEFARAAVAPPTINTPSISQICATQSSETSSEFVDRGSGGIPASPSDALNSSYGWNNEIETVSNKKSEQLTHTETIQQDQYIEAQGWEDNKDGTVSFTTTPNEVFFYSSLSDPTCQTSSKSQD